MCIVRYLETSKYCPICDVQVHKTKPLLNIRWLNFPSRSFYLHALHAKRGEIACASIYFCVYFCVRHICLLLYVSISTCLLLHVYFYICISVCVYFDMYISFFFKKKKKLTGRLPPLLVMIILRLVLDETKWYCLYTSGQIKHSKTLCTSWFPGCSKVSGWLLVRLCVVTAMLRIKKRVFCILVISFYWFFFCFNHSFLQEV